MIELIPTRAEATVYWFRTGIRHPLVGNLAAIEQMKGAPHG